MDFRTITDRINSGGYKVNKSDYVVINKVPDTHVFDENRSVRWNKQECERINEEHRLQVQKYNQASNNCEIQFRNDCIQAIIVEYGFNLATSEKIYSKAYSDGHSYGYHEVVTYCERLCGFVEEILKCNER